MLNSSSQKVSKCSQTSLVWRSSGRKPQIRLPQLLALSMRGIKIPYGQALLVFLALLAISGRDASTLHRDGVLESILLRLLLLPYDRRENSASA